MRPDIDNPAISNPDPDQIKGAPFGLLWSITQRCNLSCTYCHASGASDDFIELPHDTIFKIAGILKDVNVRNYVLNGGEPLMRDDFFEIVDTLKENGARVAFNTNGTLVSDRVARMIGERNLVTGVSIDGPTESINSLTRGRGALKPALKAVERLLENNVTVNVLLNVTRHNFEHILSLCKLVFSMGVRIVGLQDFHPIGRGTGQYEKFTLLPRQEKKVLWTMGQIAKRFPELQVGQTGFAYWATLGHPDDDRCIKSKPYNILEGKSCGRGMYIDAAGNMFRCPSLMMIPMGNILEDDILDAWLNSEGSRIFNDISAIPVSKIPGCADCEHNRQCGGGCRGDAFILYGDWLAPHPRCPRSPNYPYKPDGT